MWFFVLRRRRSTAPAATARGVTARAVTARAMAVAAAVLLAACSSPPSTPSTPSAPAADGDMAGRRAAVTETRTLVVEPAQHLGTAAATVASRLDDVVDRPGPDTVAALREAVTELEQARDEVDQLELDPTTPDVRAADEALADAMAGARRMGEAGTVVATAADQASTADQALDELVAAWDEPGSRSQLLARLDETALAADALATVEVEVPPEGCPGPVESRVAAASFVADASRELRELVAARDGVAFDARRAQLAEAPFGHDEAGTPREYQGSIDVDDCPAVQAAQASAAAVTRALQDLQAALNPQDLAG